MISLTDYCLFTVEHLKARRIYVRGVADITEPIDEYDKIIKFYNGSKLQSELPPNPYKKGEKEYTLFNELKELIQDNFEEIGDELVFAKVGEKLGAYRYLDAKYHIDKEKVII